MDISPFHKIRCPHCKGSLNLKIENRHGQIWSCNCYEYPYVEGILYLKKDKLAKRASFLIEHGDYKKAAVTLTNQKRRLSIPISYLLFPKYPRGIFGGLFKKNIYEILGFKRIITILSHFSYPKPWVTYIRNRERMPSFWTSYYGANILKKDSQNVIDIGCGTGQFLKVLAKKTNPENVYGIDLSFLNLLLARRFFAHPKTSLICTDAEYGLPMISNSFDLILSSDSFHDLEKKHFFLKESKRVINQKGVLVSLHIVNSKKVVFGNIKGITPSKLYSLLERVGLNHNVIYSNSTLWMKLSQHSVLRLETNYNWEDLKNTFAFGFFAGKSKLPASVDLLPKEYRKFNHIKMDFSLDKELIRDIHYRKLLSKKYKSFIFLSPHLDDAILSCGLLIEHLVQAGKEVLIISIFTRAESRPYSEHAQKFVLKSGFRDADKLFLDRKSEDYKSCEVIGSSLLHLNFVDATFRKTFLYRKFSILSQILENHPSLVHVYPDPQNQFSGEISFEDRVLKKELEKDLKSSIGKNFNESVIFSPMGIGGHADHIIIREMTKALARQKGYPALFWEDFPYNLNLHTIDKFNSEDHSFKEFLKVAAGVSSWPKKYRAIRLYKSQMNVLFPGGKIPKIPERYYYSKDLTKDKNLFPAIGDA